MEPDEEALWRGRGVAPLLDKEATVWTLDLEPEERSAALERTPPLDERMPWAWGRAVSVLFDRRLRTERWLAECVAAGFETLSVSITIDPDIRGGVPVMKGTRFTVAQALAELAETSGVTEFAEEFDIDPTVVRNMLGGLSLILHRSCTK
jgi:uncharacterized protein (DUF433 family)